MATSCTTSTAGHDSRRACLATAVVGLLLSSPLLLKSQPFSHSEPLSTAAASSPDSRGVSRKPAETVRTVEIGYRSHTGARRGAVRRVAGLVRARQQPAATGRDLAARAWSDRTSRTRSFFDRLPAVGRFIVISPDGMGDRLRNFSYGAPGHIDDLARMPDLVSAALPWLRIDRSRIYALGSSMGGQETLLLVARHPGLLAGAAALDSVTDLARRHGQLPDLPCSESCAARWGKSYGTVLQSTLEREVGGSPSEQARAYAERSGLSQARAIASSRVPLQLWWSTEDRIVSDQEHQSEALFDELRRVDDCASVSAFVGDWAHSREMRASALLPIVLSGFGLLPGDVKALPASVRHLAAPRCADRSSTV